MYWGGGEGRGRIAGTHSSNCTTCIIIVTLCHKRAIKLACCYSPFLRTSGHFQSFTTLATSTCSRPCCSCHVWTIPPHSVSARDKDCKLNAFFLQSSPSKTVSCVVLLRAEGNSLMPDKGMLLIRGLVKRLHNFVTFTFCSL